MHLSRGNEVYNIWEDTISRELEEMGQAEIQSNVTGKMVMDALKEVVDLCASFPIYSD